MKNSDKNIEMKIYEKLGIKKFKKIVLEVGYGFCKMIDKDCTRERYYRSSSNYRMKKGNGMQDLKDFKKMLLINSGVHSYFFLHCCYVILCSGALLPALLIESIPLVINGYCIMLQRYNWLRIQRVLKKGEPIEEKKREDICEELESVEHISDKCIHKVIEDDKFTDITVEEIKESVNLKQLKKYRDILKEIQKDKDESKCRVIPLDNGKVLGLYYHPNEWNRRD